MFVCLLWICDIFFKKLSIFVVSKKTLQVYVQKFDIVRFWSIKTEQKNENQIEIDLISGNDSKTDQTQNW